MNREQTKELIEVMQHFVDGGEVEYFSSAHGAWYTVEHPTWADHVKYRIKKLTKPSIDWSHVAPEFKWMATDEVWDTYLYQEEPTRRLGGWVVESYQIDVEGFASFKRGNCNWKDSLIKRPEDY